MNYKLQNDFAECLSSDMVFKIMAEIAQRAHGKREIMSIRNI